jgi:hypothetical protein
MRTSCVPFYDTYWTIRGAQEFEMMFGRTPFHGPEFVAVSEEQLEQFMTSFHEEMRRTTVHFGEGRMNPSTIAAVFALVEERVTGRPVTASPDSAMSRALFAMIGMSASRQTHTP